MMFLAMIVNLRVYSMYYGYKWFQSEPRFCMFRDALYDYETLLGRVHPLDKKLIW